MIKVGDTVRSFDFDGGRDLSGPRACYVEGEVVDIQSSEYCPCYVIRVDREVFGGIEETHRLGVEVTTPVNGTPTTSGKVCDFVELIDS